MSDVDIPEDNGGEVTTETEDVTQIDNAEQNSGEAVFTSLDIYDPTTVRGAVRFWLRDTDPTCREPNAYLFPNEEIDSLLLFAGYHDDPEAIWGNIPAITTYYYDEPNYTHVYRNYGQWSSHYAYVSSNNCISVSILCKIYMAASLGWRAVAGDAALLAGIVRDSLFSNDTWTTYKAILARADDMERLARQYSVGGIRQSTHHLHTDGERW